MVTIFTLVALAAQLSASTVLRIYVAGAPTALSLAAVFPANISCDEAPPTGSPMNPTRWVWDDPQLSTRVCIYLDTLRLDALPDGSYEGTAQTIADDGSGSAETPRVPFTRLRPLSGCTTNGQTYPIGYDSFKVVVRKQEIAAQDAKMVGWTRIATVQTKGNYELTYRCGA